MYGKGTRITGEACRLSSSSRSSVQASTPIGNPLCHSPGEWFPSLVLELFLNGKKKKVENHCGYERIHISRFIQWLSFRSNVALGNNCADSRAQGGSEYSHQQSQAPRRHSRQWGTIRNCSPCRCVCAFPGPTLWKVVPERAKQHPFEKAQMT